MPRGDGVREILWFSRIFFWLAMHQLRRDRRPGDHGKSNLEKIILAVFREENAVHTECHGRFEFNPELAEKRNEFVLYAGIISGVRKEKRPSFGFSRSIFPKAHSTADLTSVKSTGFIA